MQNIDEFIEQLLKDKDVTDLAPETKAELISDMKTRLLDQVNRAAIMELPDDKAEELAHLVEDPNFTDEQMAEFVQNAGVNLTEVALETMLKFRSFYLGIDPEENE